MFHETLETIITEYWCSMGLALIIGCLLLSWKEHLESKTPVPSVPMLPQSHWLLGHLFWLLGKDYLDKQRALSTLKPLCLLDWTNAKISEFDFSRGCSAVASPSSYSTQCSLAETPF